MSIFFYFHCFFYLFIKIDQIECTGIKRQQFFIITLSLINDNYIVNIYLLYALVWSFTPFELYAEY